MACLKSARSLSMNAMSPVAPVLEIFFHRFEIMKFHDQRNPDSSCSYLAFVFPSGCLDITELLASLESSLASSLASCPLFRSTMPLLNPWIPLTRASWSNLNSKLF